MIFSVPWNGKKGGGHCRRILFIFTAWWIRDKVMRAIQIELLLRNIIPNCGPWRCGFGSDWFLINTSIVSSGSFLFRLIKRRLINSLSSDFRKIHSLPASQTPWGLEKRGEEEEKKQKAEMNINIDEISWFRL